MMISYYFAELTTLLIILGSTKLSADFVYLRCVHLYNLEFACSNTYLELTSSTRH